MQWNHASFYCIHLIEFWMTFISQLHMYTSIGKYKIQMMAKDTTSKFRSICQWCTYLKVAFPCEMFNAMLHKRTIILWSHLYWKLTNFKCFLYFLSYPFLIETSFSRRNCKSNPFCLTAIGESRWLSDVPETVTDIEDPAEEKRQERNFVGLKNLGATCYVNSLLQLWFHNSAFR